VEIDDIRVSEVCHLQVPTKTWVSQVGYKHKRIAIKSGTLHPSSELLLGKGWHADLSASNTIL
jgi:hypothetical protein